MIREPDIREAIAPRRHHGRRGVVLILVLSLVAIATILSYGMLAAAAMEAQSAAHAAASIRAQAMAENGVNVAMHYLMNPQDSPVPLVKGGAGDWHYPGQANLSMGEDTVSVTVTNPQPAVYRIRAVGRSLDAEGEICERELAVRVLGISAWAARGAAQFSKNVQLAGNVTVNGNLVSAGSYLGGGTVTGSILAANHTAHDGDPKWAAPPLLPELAVPSFDSLNLVRAVSGDGGWYIHNGQRGKVDYILTETLETPPTPSASNIGRVFVYAGSTPLVLAGAAPATFDGTLLVTQADVQVKNAWTFTPQSGMPAMLLPGSMTLEADAAQLVANGVVYLGDGFGTSHSLAVTPITVNGAFLSPRTSLSALASEIPGNVSFTFDPNKADVPDLTDQGTRYTRLQIESWELVN